MTASLDPGNRPPTTPWRRRRMIAAAIMLSLTPIVLIEICVRVFATPAEAVDLDPIAGLDHIRPLFELNMASGRFEIPESRFQFFRPDSFPQIKSSQTRRIFVLGGSTVQGRPYSTETAFSTWLRLRLETADPDHAYEVVNGGGVSYASYRVAKILDEVLHYEPDAIVLYTGHNEFLEDRTYAHVRRLGPLRRGLTRVASYWATVGWLQQTLLKKSDLKPIPIAAEVDTRLDHPGGLESYVRDPAWRADVRSRFAASVQHMIHVTADAGIPLLVCTPASDIVNTPPFKVDEIDAIDTYLTGRKKYDAGRATEASRLLTQARDNDLCPLRATSPIIDTVNELCDANDVPLIDTESLFDVRDNAGAKVPDGIADPEFFADHVHPTIAGHQRIAKALANRFEQLGWIEQSDASESKYQRAAAGHLQTLDETYYARGRQRLEGLRRWAAGRASLPLAE